MFPKHVESLDPNAGVGYEIVGDLHQGLEDRYDKIKWISITQEFGTFKPVRVIRASRDENRWTQWGQYDTESEAKDHWSRTENDFFIQGKLSIDALNRQYLAECRKSYHVAILLHLLPQHLLI